MPAVPLEGASQRRLRDIRMSTDVHDADLRIQSCERGLQNLVLDSLHVDVDKIDPFAVRENRFERQPRHRAKLVTGKADPALELLRPYGSMSPDLFRRIRTGKEDGSAISIGGGAVTQVVLLRVDVVVA